MYIMQTTHFHASFAHVYTTVKSAMHIINKVELIPVVVCSKYLVHICAAGFMCLVVGLGSYRLKSSVGITYCLLVEFNHKKEAY